MRVLFLPMKSPRRPSIRTASPGLRLAADIGGTFTDVATFDSTTGTLRFGKALSTPHHLVEGITAGVGKAGTAGFLIRLTTIVAAASA